MTLLFMADSSGASLINDRNLPAVLLSIRTLLPMAKTRLRLFQSVATVYPSLIQLETRMQAALEAKHTKTSALSTLVDPLVMELLSLQNAKGAQLDVKFAIGFNRWGHAIPTITVKPSLPPSSE